MIKENTYKVFSTQGLVDSEHSRNTIYHCTYDDLGIIIIIHNGKLITWRMVRKRVFWLTMFISRGAWVA